MSRTTISVSSSSWLSIQFFFVVEYIYIYIFFYSFGHFERRNGLLDARSRIYIYNNAWRDKSIPPGKVETLLSFVPGRKARKGQIEEKLETLEQRKKADLKESVWMLENVVEKTLSTPSWSRFLIRLGRERPIIWKLVDPIPNFPDVKDVRNCRGDRVSFRSKREFDRR